MRNLILLSGLFILLDIVGSWIPIYLANSGSQPGPLTFELIFEGIGFRLFFALWYWIIGYSAWFLINICIFLILPRSIIRSVIISAYMPILIMVTLSEFNLVIVWYCLLGVFFGLLFHKYAIKKHDILILKGR